MLFFTKHFFDRLNPENYFVTRLLFVWYDVLVGTVHITGFKEQKGGGICDN